MERAEYEALAHKMQQLAREDPLAYRRKVMRWARGGLLGYWGIFCFALFLAAFIALIMVFGNFINGLLIILVFGLLGAAAGMLRTVKDPEPTHLLELPLERAPAYHRVVADLVQKMNAPKIDALAVSASFNAAAMVQRRPFRRPRYIVEVGLILLATFSPDEAKAVIAHELAHHVSDDARDGLRIQRLYRRWELAAQAAQHSSILATIGKGFVEWYFPRFSAITAAYRLQCELDADRRAAEAVSKEALASGLLRLLVVEECVIEPAWRSHLDELTSTGSQVLRFNEYFTTHAPSVRPNDAIDPLRFGLQRTTTIDDSHPAHLERILNIGVDLGEKPDYEQLAMTAVRLPNPSAAKAFLGDDLDWITSRLDDLIGTQNADSIRKDLEDRRKAYELAEKPLEGMSVEELLERANALLGLQRRDEALAVAHQAYKIEPSNPDVLATRGILLLATGDESGLGVLTQLAADSPGFAALAHEQMAMYLSRHGRSEEARDLAIKAQEFAETQEQKQNALINLSNELDWFPHGATPEEVQSFIEFCRNFPFILCAYIVERRDTEWTDFKIQVGLLVFEPPTYYIDEDSAISSFINKIKNSGIESPIYCYATLPKLKAAKHAAQYVQPVYVRGQ
ncbi:MAG: M48 family metalloprotease [Fimbriimonadaceae bacterium]|nr:M48 family metalloprotease [Fimbriimonadaceae bacterium]